MKCIYVNHKVLNKHTLLKCTNVYNWCLQVRSVWRGRQSHLQDLPWLPQDEVLHSTHCHFVCTATLSLYSWDIFKVKASGSKIANHVYEHVP